MRGVGKALADLAGHLIHRPLALREHVHDLRPSATPNACATDANASKSASFATRSLKLKLSFDYEIRQWHDRRVHQAPPERGVTQNGSGSERVPSE